MGDWREHKGYLPPGWVADHKAMTITQVEDEVVIHCDYEVCSGCQGKGTCVNPAIDGHGISAEEWNEWDMEDREAYCSGRYDVACPRCGGLRVMLVPQEDDPNREALEKAWHEEANYRAEQDAERRMGA